MKRSVQLLLALFAALALAACSTTEPADDTTDTTVQQDDGSDAEAEALARQRAAEEAERQRIAALLENTTIYFDFDSDADIDFNDLTAMIAAIGTVSDAPRNRMSAATVQIVRPASVK